MKVSVCRQSNDCLSDTIDKYTTIYIKCNLNVLCFTTRIGSRLNVCKHNLKPDIRLMQSAWKWGTT